MKQLLQSLNNGITELVEVPVPKTEFGSNLIKTSKTLVSAGTEKMLVEFGKSNLINKARAHPDKVKLVLEKVRTDGLATTLDAVKSKLNRLVPLGYCNVGKVVETNSTSFSVGDRVVSNGSHAEVVCVPNNLCALIPDNVTDEVASFTVLAAVGLQGIRLVKPSLGERVVVIGLGLIGLLTVQMLKANGCHVVGVDVDPNRLDFARSLGVDVANPNAGDKIFSKIDSFSRGNGADAVIITAATSSNEPISNAAKFCRRRGRIVLVGVTGLELNRSDFYEKEITFQVSCSYGPGRYDVSYEEKGQDYPIGFVRWTEQRNFEAVLDMMSSGSLNIKPLISHRFDITDGIKAMDLLTSNEPSMGIILSFSNSDKKNSFKRKIKIENYTKELILNEERAPSVAFFGAGNYAGRVLIPSFKSTGATLHTIVSSGGISAVHYGRKHKFAFANTDNKSVLEDPSIDIVVIATRHNLHAEQVIASLRAGKHVYCEKPLCLTLEELSQIEQECSLRTDQKLMVGFNRRFASQTIKMKDLLSKIKEPKHFQMTVNAGEIPEDHWTQSTDVGGRRIIGEACHFIDLIRYLAGNPISNWYTAGLQMQSMKKISDDKVSITLEFEDGSVGLINYLANGHKSVSKERLEVFVAGRVLQLDNFRRLVAYGWKGYYGSKLWKQDKGQNAAALHFIHSVKTGSECPIPLDEVLESSRIAINIGRSLF